MRTVLKPWLQLKGVQRVIDDFFHRAKVPLAKLLLDDALVFG